MALDASASSTADSAWALAVAGRLAEELADLRQAIGSLQSASWRSAAAESFARAVHDVARELARGEAALDDGIRELAARR